MPLYDPVSRHFSLFILETRKTERKHDPEIGRKCRKKKTVNDYNRKMELRKQLEINV